MNRNFDEILDECVDRINQGQSIDDCLADYPDQANKLEPLLRAMLVSQKAYLFIPSPLKKDAARQRFNTTVSELEIGKELEQPLFWRLLRQPRVWAPTVAIMIIALVGYFGLRPVLFPQQITDGDSQVPIIVSPQPDPSGDFAFLISDEVNAIEDFGSLNITISKIGLNLGGDDGQWHEIEPLINVVDLTLLKGDRAQEIWRGDIPTGQYHKVFIHVDNVTGVLNTGNITEVKLPSNKLQISLSFQVTGDSKVNFVYDLTLIARGSSRSGIKYTLQPQIGESGAGRKFELIDNQ